MTGSFNPSPQRFGDSSGTVYEIFLDAMNAADGDALNHEVDSFVYAENIAISRALVDIWSANTRLSYQFDPNRMTDFLPRWEVILGIIPNPGSTANQRRKVIATKISNYGKAGTEQVISDLMAASLDGMFVSILNNIPSIAVASVPGGAVVPGGVTLPSGDWTSSTASIAIVVQQPATMPDNTFYLMVGEIDSLLENVLPAWVTFNWVRNNSLGVGGFLLDDPHNLDNEYFDV